MAVKPNTIRMDFEDNDILALLSGEHNHYLAHIEKSLDVSLDSFGNSIKITGPAKSTKTARRVIEDLYKTVEKLQSTQEMNMTNKVNIQFLQKQMEKALIDIERLKDSNREMKYTNGH